MDIALWLPGMGGSCDMHGAGGDEALWCSAAGRKVALVIS